MQLQFHHTYLGTPDQVVALFRNPEFLVDVARHSGSQEQEASVEGDATRLRMKLESPSDVAAFIGKTVTVVMDFRWGPSSASGERTGSVDVEVPGMPVRIVAGCVLRAAATGSEADYSGDLKVRIPLVGGKVEKKVAPFITDAFWGIQRRANEWLSRG